MVLKLHPVFLRGTIFKLHLLHLLCVLLKRSERILSIVLILHLIRNIHSQFLATSYSHLKATNWPMWTFCLQSAFPLISLLLSLTLDAASLHWNALLQDKSFREGVCARTMKIRNEMTYWGVKIKFYTTHSLRTVIRQANASEDIALASAAAAAAAAHRRRRGGQCSFSLLDAVVLARGSRDVRELTLCFRTRHDVTLLNYCGSLLVVVPVSFLISRRDLRSDVEYIWAIIGCAWTWYLFTF